MKLVNSITVAVLAWIAVRRVTIIAWAAFILIVTVSTLVSQSQHAAIVARLSSPQIPVRDAAVLSLARSGQLSDTLLTTEDPAGDAADAQNVESAVIRQNAGDSLLRVLSQLTSAQAFATLYSLQKDAVTAPDAVTGLTTLGSMSSQNLKTLADGLGDGDPDVRTASVAALINIGGAKVAALVAPMVRDDTSQDSAIAALAGLGKYAVPYVTAYMQDPKSTEALKEEAAATLGTIGDPSAAPALENAAVASPPAPQLRRVCLTSLAMIVISTVPQPGMAPSAPATPDKQLQIAEASAESPVLVASVENENDDSFARAREALALGRLATKQATAALVNMLGKFDVRLAVAAQTGVESAGSIAVPQLAAVIRDPRESVRISAATALGVIGTDAAIDALKPALKDPSPLVRAAAAAGLGRGMNPKAVPTLIAALHDPDGSVADAASVSLHELGSPAVAPLVDALSPDTAHDTAPFFASQALSADGEAAIPALTAASLAAPSEPKKVWITVTLGTIHNPSVVATLRRLAADPEAPVSWAATQALNQYSG